MGESSRQGANGVYGGATSSSFTEDTSTGYASTTFQSSEPGSPHLLTRSDRSVLMAVLITLVKLVGRSLVHPPNPPIPPGSPRLRPPSVVKKNHGISVKERKVGGMWVYNIRSATGAGVRHPHHNDNTLKMSVDTRMRIFVIAGGGFRMKPMKEHWLLCAYLAMKFPYDMVTLISAPLAPESTAPTAFPKLVEVYKMLAREATGIGETVALVGDSSGGNLCLSLPMAALGEPRLDPRAIFRDYAPKHIILISPAVDLTNTNQEMKTAERNDPLLSMAMTDEVAKTWAGSWSRDDTRLSPLYGDLSLFRSAGTQIHGISGTYDTLHPDVVRLKDMCDKFGIKGEWLFWEKQMHCFPLTAAYGLREGKEGREWIVDRFRAKKS